MMMRSRLAWIWTLAAGCAMFAAKSGTARGAGPRDRAFLPYPRGHQSGDRAGGGARFRRARRSRISKRKNFRLLDSGKPQEIYRIRSGDYGFDDEIARTGRHDASPLATVAVLPRRNDSSLCFLTTSTCPSRTSREHAMPHGTICRRRLRPEDRVAMFTSSGKEQVDFTYDRDKLHDALFRMARAFAHHSSVQPLPVDWGIPGLPHRSSAGCQRPCNSDRRGPRVPLWAKERSAACRERRRPAGAIRCGRRSGTSPISNRRRP